ncbi:hypothetical protein [Arcobacter sp.]|uniref:hypothetical protein n=1 Tax=Arcobacter sp. TaxID=1872629 RepID=UPI003C78137D
MNATKEFNQITHILNHDQIDTLHKEFFDIYASADIDSLESIIQKSKELLLHSENLY